MVETIYLSKVREEDLDLGTSTRSVLLHDNAFYTLHQISAGGSLAVKETRTQAATASASSLTITFSNPPASRIHGVTLAILTTLGTTNGLTSIDIGTSRIPMLWGDNVGITLGTTTTPANFWSDVEPIDDDGNFAVVIRGNGGTFDGTGSIAVQLHYSLLAHR
jgi:hypothetical protein